MRAATARVDGLAAFAFITDSSSFLGRSLIVGNDFPLCNISNESND